jgi:ATP-dependent Clp protease ATP-binding subunit ClpA
MSSDPALHGASSATKAIEQTFSPEFRNRLDSIVNFHSLDPATVKQVVAKHLMELESQLLGKNVDVEFEPEVKDWLAEKGYDRQMGARPLARLLQEKIKKPLSEEILFGRLENGGKLKICLRQQQIAFEILTPVQGGAPESVDVYPEARRVH